MVKEHDQTDLAFTSILCTQEALLRKNKGSLWIKAGKYSGYNMCYLKVRARRFGAIDRVGLG